MLAVSQRAAVVTKALQDRAAEVREAAGSLLASWLGSCCDDSLEELVAALGVEEHPGRARIGAGLGFGLY